MTTDSGGRDGPASGDVPEYGPSGYLPHRAASRARKIVLRGPMSIGWAAASIVAGVVLLAAGVAFWLLQLGPPGQPHQPVVDLADLEPATAATVTVDGASALLVRAGGRVHAFRAPDEAPVRWCPASGRLEGADGAVWLPDGRASGGGASSLVPLGVEVHDGTVYVDARTTREPPPPASRDEAPQCEPTDP